MKALKRFLSIEFICGLFFVVGSAFMATCYDVTDSDFLKIGSCLIMYYFGMEFLVDFIGCSKEEK